MMQFPPYAKLTALNVPGFDPFIIRSQVLSGFPGKNIIKYGNRLHIPNKHFFACATESLSTARNAVSLMKFLFNESINAASLLPPNQTQNIRMPGVN